MVELLKDLYTNVGFNLLYLIFGGEFVWLIEIIKTVLCNICTATVPIEKPPEHDL